MPVSGGRLEIKNVVQDGKLTIAWRQAPASPTQKTYTVVGTVTENGQPAAGITLELRSKLKTFVTGADGKQQERLVTTVFDILAASLAIDRGHGGMWRPVTKTLGPTPLPHGRRLSQASPPRI